MVKSLYAHLPKHIQEFAIGIYGLKRNTVRYGTAFKEFVPQLMDSYYWDRDMFISYQIEQLNRLISFAKHASPYYARCLKDVGGISDIGELKSLPILTKALLKKHMDSIRCTGRRGTFNFNTSGTTGSPLQITLKGTDWAREYAFVWRQRAIAGVTRTDKVASFIGRTLVKPQEARCFWRYNFADNQLMFSSYHMNESNLKLYIEKLNRWKPDYIHGYPSSISAISKFAIDHNIDLHIPKAVFTSSETLFQHQRANIESAFSTKVYDYYGSTERAGVITECPYGKYHVNIESGILEVSNNRFYWTSFLNTGTPLIRYEIGDTGTLAGNQERCLCGSSFPVIEELTGREEDSIITADGSPLGRLDHIFKSEIPVVEAQIVQNIRGEAEIRVVLEPYADVSDVEESITEHFEERVGNRLKITVKPVTSIPRTKSGKLKFVVSNVRDAYKP